MLSSPFCLSPLSFAPFCDFLCFENHSFQLYALFTASGLVTLYFSYFHSNFVLAFSCISAVIWGWNCFCGFFPNLPSGTLKSLLILRILWHCELLCCSHSYAEVGLGASEQALLLMWITKDALQNIICTWQLSRKWRGGSMQDFRGKKICLSGDLMLGSV